MIVALVPPSSNHRHRLRRGRLRCLHRPPTMERAQIRAPTLQTATAMTVGLVPSTSSASSTQYAKRDRSAVPKSTCSCVAADGQRSNPSPLDFPPRTAGIVEQHRRRRHQGRKGRPLHCPRPYHHPRRLHHRRPSRRALPSRAPTHAATHLTKIAMSNRSRDRTTAPYPQRVLTALLTASGPIPLPHSGGVGSEYEICSLGTDCADCERRCVALQALLRPTTALRIASSDSSA